MGEFAGSAPAPRRRCRPTVDRRDTPTPPVATTSISCRADRRRDPKPIHNLGLAGRQPALGLVHMAFGTAAVLAGAIVEDRCGTLVATPEAASERLGAAGPDVGDGAPKRCRHRGAMSRQVVAGEAAKDVRDLDHDGSVGSEAGHQCVEDASERDVGRFGEVGADGGCGDMDAPEQNLHDPGVDAVFEQSRCIAVA